MFKQIDGLAGRIRAGTRPVTSFKRWTAVPVNGHWRLSVHEHEPDPLYWQTFDDSREVVVVLELGQSSQRGRARLLSREPLELEVWEIERA